MLKIIFIPFLLIIVLTFSSCFQIEPDSNSVSSSSDWIIYEQSLQWPILLDSVGGSFILLEEQNYCVDHALQLIRMPTEVFFEKENENLLIWKNGDCFEDVFQPENSIPQENISGSWTLKSAASISVSQSFQQDHGYPSDLCTETLEQSSWLKINQALELSQDSLWIESRFEICPANKEEESWKNAYSNITSDSPDCRTLMLELSGKKATIYFYPTASKWGPRKVFSSGNASCSYDPKNEMESDSTTCATNGNEYNQYNDCIRASGFLGES